MMRRTYRLGYTSAMLLKTRSAVTIGVLLLTTGCGKRVPLPAAPGPSGTPHVGWVIMVGDRDNPNREFVCQSDPRTACVLPVSRPDGQVFTDVHFYFHPAKTEATYRGTILIPFFEGSTPHELKSNVTVKQGEAIANSSVSGIVPSKPGTYPMTIDVVAESGGATQRIRERVPVIVN
jgi:hypothetical protein